VAVRWADAESSQRQRSPCDRLPQSSSPTTRMDPIYAPGPGSRSLVRMPGSEDAAEVERSQASSRQVSPSSAWQCEPPGPTVIAARAVGARLSSSLARLTRTGPKPQAPRRGPPGIVSTRCNTYIPPDVGRQNARVLPPHSLELSVRRRLRATGPDPQSKDCGPDQQWSGSMPEAGR
jgi:hypothetical protein